MVLLVDERPEEVTDMRATCCRARWSRSTFDRPSDEHTAGRRAHDRAGQAPRRDGQGRRDRARRHHPSRPGLQPRGAGVGPHHVGWCRLDRAVPAEAVLRCGPQHRGGRLAHDHRDRARRDGQPDGRGDLRGVQGHRQHGAAARPPPRRAPHLPGDRRRGVEHPPRGAALRPRPAQPGLEAAPGAQRARRRAGGRASSCSSTSSAPPRATTSSSPRSPRPRRRAPEPRRESERPGVVADSHAEPRRLEHS